MHVCMCASFHFTRYATLKRGDIVTAVNDIPVLDLEYREICQELLKAGMPVTLTVLSGRIDFVRRRAVEYVVCGGHMLEWR